MAIGGTLDRASYPDPWQVNLAYAGRTVFEQTRWGRCQSRCWVLDMLHGTPQLQRLETGEAFEREPGLAALYAPGTVHHEYQDAGTSIMESYLTFDLAEGATAAYLRRFAQAGGVGWFEDPHGVLACRIQTIARLLADRRPGFQFEALAGTAGLMALLIDAEPVRASRWRVRPARTADGMDLRSRVERYVAAHLAEPVSVTDVAEYLEMSPSALAHRYPTDAGETPYRTILRVKLAHARELLLQQRLSVKATAAALGFTNEFSFSRTFKQHEGISPGQFVKALTERHQS